MSTCKTEENEKTEPLSFDNLVSYHDSFIDNHEFLNDLQMELHSMDLYRPQSKKPSSFWICDEHHKLQDIKTNVGKFSQYPAISKLRELVNNDESVPESDLDCCNIML